MVALPLMSPEPIGFAREAATVVAPPFSGFSTVVSPDGTAALTVGKDDSLVFWRVAPTGAMTFLDALRIRRGFMPTGHWTTVALGAQGRRFALTGLGGRVEAWDRVTGKRLFLGVYGGLLPGPVAFHPTQPWLLVSLPKGTARIDLDTGRGVVLDARWPLVPIPNSGLLASPSGIFDGTTGRLVRPLRGPTANIEPLRASPDGKLLMMGGEDPRWRVPKGGYDEIAFRRDQILRVWRVADGRLLSTMPGFRRTTGGPAELAWLDERRIAIPDLRTVYDARTGRAAPGYDPKSPMFRWTFDPPSVIVRVGKADRRLTLRFPESGVRIRGIAFRPGEIVAVHEVENGFRDRSAADYPTFLATTQRGYSRGTKSNPALVDSPLGFDERGPVAREAWGRQGPAGFAFIEVVARVTDGRELEVRRTLLAPGSPPRVETSTAASLYEADQAVPEGYDAKRERFAAVRGEGAVFLASDVDSHRGVFALSLRDGRELWRIEAPGLYVDRSTPAAGRGKVAFWRHAASSGPGELIVADAATGRVLRRLPTPWPAALSISPDGRTLALGHDGAVATLDLTNPRATPRLLGEGRTLRDATVAALTFYWAPSGRLVVASAARPIEVFDLKTGRRLATARFFGDGSWSALRADGLTDGTARTEARVWQGGRWIPAERWEPFFLDLLR